MPLYYAITYLPEGRVETYTGSRGNYYELENGEKLDVQTRPVWCRCCGGISEGEEIETVEAIDRKISELRDPTSSAYRLVARGVFHQMSGRGDTFLEEHTREWGRRRRWRERRQSPPRCIECGSADIVPIPLAEQMPDPRGSGWIVMRIRGLCSTAYNDWYFSPEGDRIRGEVPPWRLRRPELDNSPEAVREFFRLCLGSELPEPNE